MKKLSIKIGLIAIITIFSSCAVQKSYTLSSTYLSKSKFNYAKNDVTSTSRATYIFGLGSHSKGDLMNKAKDQLFESNSLKGDQSFVNINVSWKMTYILPFVIANRCTVSADIVEVNKSKVALATALAVR
jgi:hypothetical protein